MDRAAQELSFQRESSAGGDHAFHRPSAGSTCRGEDVIDHEGAGGRTPPFTHYEFTSEGREQSHFNVDDKDIQESLRQWGLEKTLTAAKIHFKPAFMPHEETTFMRQLLAFVGGTKLAPNARRGTTAQGEQWESVKCTVVSMDFFDCLFEKGIVTETGTIRGCYSEDFDGVTVTDKIRELLVNTDTENAHIFSADQQRELIFHLFKALCVGGAICQPSENLDAYMRATKALYKDLVSVRKNGTTGKLEIAPCNVYRIPGTSGGHFGSGEDRISESPHHVCIVAVDLAKKRATVLRNEFTPFW